MLPVGFATQVSRLSPAARVGSKGMVHQSLAPGQPSDAQGRLLTRQHVSALALRDCVAATSKVDRVGVGPRAEGHSVRVRAVLDGGAHRVRAVPARAVGVGVDARAAGGSGAGQGRARGVGAKPIWDILSMRAGPSSAHGSVKDLRGRRGTVRGSTCSDACIRPSLQLPSHSCMSREGRTHRTEEPAVSR
jgi:hypothetical protein